jgi:RsiW-degrading membrane proteinase PrsW (M82 family)
MEKIKLKIYFFIIPVIFGIPFLIFWIIIYYFNYQNLGKLFLILMILFGIIILFDIIMIIVTKLEERKLNKENEEFEKENQMSILP